MGEPHERYRVIPHEPEMQSIGQQFAGHGVLAPLGHQPPEFALEGMHVAGEDLTLRGPPVVMQAMNPPAVHRLAH